MGLRMVGVRLIYQPLCMVHDFLLVCVRLRILINGCLMYGYSSYKSQEMDWVSKARSVFENNDTSPHDIDAILHLISTSHSS